jgi:hypothetical protein
MIYLYHRDLGKVPGAKLGKFKFLQILLDYEHYVQLNLAPATETDVLPIANTNGIVKGIVTKGILNLTEKAGTEQVQYTQHPEPSGTNTIYYGQ